MLLRTSIETRLSKYRAKGVVWINIIIFWTNELSAIAVFGAEIFLTVLSFSCNGTVILLCYAINNDKD